MNRYNSVICDFCATAPVGYGDVNIKVMYAHELSHSSAKTFQRGEESKEETARFDKSIVCYGCKGRS